MINLSQLIIPPFLKHSLLQAFMTLLNQYSCLQLYYLILKQSWDISSLSLYIIYILILDDIQESNIFKYCLYSNNSQHSVTDHTSVFNRNLKIFTDKQNSLFLLQAPTHTVQFLCFLMIVCHTIMCPVPQIKT